MELVHFNEVPTGVKETDAQYTEYPTIRRVWTTLSR